MKEVDNYIDSIYKNIHGNKKEISEGKQEIKNHLLQSISELESQGFSENESIDIAIKRFGDATKLKIELNELYKLQKDSFKRILTLAKLFLIIGFAAFILKIAVLARSNNIEQTLSYKFSNSIKNSNVISQDKVKNLYESNKNIKFLYNNDLKYIAVYKYPSQFKGDLSHISPKKETAKYIYPSLKVLDADQKNNGYIANSVTTISLKINGDKYLISLAFMSPTYNYGLSSILNFIIVAAASVYWILFGVWATMKAQSEGNYNFNLFLSFFIFNALAYCIYESYNHKKIKAAI